MKDNKKVTIKDVSKKAGVAISTVSNALNPKSKKISDKRRAEVLEIIREMNYVPDVRGQALSSQSKTRIGFFMNNTLFKFEGENNINMQIIYYLNYFAFKKNLEIINIFSFGQADRYDNIVAKIRAYNLSDVIVFGINKNDELLKKIGNLPINKAFIDIPCNFESSFFVSTDNFQAQYDLLNECYKKKQFSNLFYIGGEENSYVGCERLNGVKSFCRYKNIKLNYQMGSFSRNHGYDSIKKYNLKNNEVIACGCDLNALGVIDYINKTDKKPIVLGFDGLVIMDYAYDNFMTVKQDIEGVSEVIINKINCKDLTSHVIGYKIINNIKE